MKVKCSSMICYQMLKFILFATVKRTSNGQFRIRVIIPWFICFFVEEECFISMITQQEFYCEIELKHLLPLLRLFDTQDFFLYSVLVCVLCTKKLHGVRSWIPLNEWMNQHTKSLIVNRRRREAPVITDLNQLILLRLMSGLRHNFFIVYRAYQLYTRTSFFFLSLARYSICLWFFVKLVVVYVWRNEVI